MKYYTYEFKKATNFGKLYSYLRSIESFKMSLEDR